MRIRDDKAEAITGKELTSGRILTAMAVFVLLASLTACAGIRAGGVDPTTVTTDEGVVQGLDSGSVVKFLGVPYAAAPTGPLRFAPPQPRAAWEGILSTKAPGPACPQTSQQDTEDCLYLNLTVPKTDKVNKPVYGFIFADPNAPPRGPIHTAELQYLFLTPTPLNPASKALSDTMIRYWSNFIVSGNPNGKGLPNWPVYKTSSDILLLAPNDVRTFDADAAHKCSSFWQPLGDAL